MLVDTTGPLVDVEALGSLHEHGLAIFVVKVTHNLVWVEIVLLNAEWCWNLTTLVHLIATEHRLTSHVLDDVVSLGVGQVTTLVNWLTLFVMVSSILVLEDNDVALLVSVKVSEHVVFVESAQVRLWWDRDHRWLLLLLEVLQHVLVHVNNAANHVHVIVGLVH